VCSNIRKELLFSKSPWAKTQLTSETSPVGPFFLFHPQHPASPSPHPRSAHHHSPRHRSLPCPVRPTQLTRVVPHTVPRRLKPAGLWTCACVVGSKDSTLFQFGIIAIPVSSPFQNPHKIFNLRINRVGFGLRNPCAARR
jgi:hypothetical protein